MCDGTDGRSQEIYAKTGLYGKYKLGKMKIPILTQKRSKIRFI